MEPHTEYARRLKGHSANRASRERQHVRLGNAKLGMVGLGLLAAWLAAGEHWISPYWILIPFAAFLILAVWHERAIRRRTKAERASAFYEQRIARLEDRWAGTGDTGERFRSDKHLYADDLDLFGRGSLFELLSAARTPMGEERLADWLKNAAPPAALRQRQQTIAELRENLDLREDLALAGDELRGRLDPEALLRWAERGTNLPSSAWRPVAALLAFGVLAALVWGVRTGEYWPLLIVVAASAILHGRLKQRVEAAIHTLNADARGLDLFWHLLQRIERESFAAPRLAESVTHLLKGRPAASTAVRRLARIAYWIEAQDSYLVRLIDFALMYSVQVAYAADTWRSRWGTRLRLWIDTVAEVEAVTSLAAYSFEHPQDPFPSFMDEETGVLFDGRELGHPLIAASRCVRNSVRLDGEHQILMVSGSNMSGKSTLLRTVGVNAVLAMAGAPIRGQSLRLTPLTVGTRLRTADSLQENRSGFYAEILRIRQVFDRTGDTIPVLFLFDELLEGTNSKDRRVGAEGLLRALIGRGSIGLVTTHDLALTEISVGLGRAVINAHFEDYVEDGRMRFDYRLRPGVIARSNALELMRLIGLEV